MSHEIKGTSQTKAQEPASALRYCTRCGAPFAAEDDDDGDLCGRCCLEPTALTALRKERNELRKQHNTLQDMLLQATKQCDELKAKLAEKDEAQELLENERKLSAEFRRRLETVERMLKDSEACLADARVERDVARNQASEALVPRSELEAAQKREAVMREALGFALECANELLEYNGEAFQFNMRGKIWSLKTRSGAALQPDAGSDTL